MKSMSIEAVLAEISAQSETGQTFLLAFVRANGVEAGSIKTVSRVRRGVPNHYQKDRTSTRTNTSPPPRLHTERGTLPLVDCDTDQYFTPFISHILRFNNYKVIH